MFKPKSIKPTVKAPKMPKPSKGGKPMMPKAGKGGKPMGFNKGGKVKGYC